MSDHNDFSVIKKPWVRGSIKVTEVMRLLKRVCVIMDTVLHFQSLVLSLLMPEVALYDKWDH